MKPDLVARLRYLIALWFVGGIALAAVTWACFQLGLNGATAAFIFLIVIVLLSLMDSLITSVIFCVVAVGCLNYFFVEPIFSFRVDSTLDVVMLIAFVLTSLIIAGLVGRMRRQLEREHKANAALQNTEQRYRHLFHDMPMALWQVNARELTALFKGLRDEQVTDLHAYMVEHPEFGRRAIDALAVEEVNRRALEMFGVRAARELTGPIARYWQESPDTFRRALAARFRGDPAFEEETKIVRPDGRIIDVLFTVAWPNDDLGIGIVGFIDIAERIRAQETLQQVRSEFAHAARISMLGELAASIAHEIIQPLTAISTTAETGLLWLERPNPNTADVSRLMRRVLRDARRASDIIGRIRSMAVGRAPEQAELSLSDVIEESMAFVRHELQRKGVSVSLDLAPALPPIIGDRTQLQQVAVNLIINAVQAMADAGTARPTLSIGAKLMDATTICCTFEDSGPGIDPLHLDHLFDSFFTTKHAGMGMGLRISRSIIESHGGQIQADNKSGLGGARFSITLPARSAAAVAR